MGILDRNRAARIVANNVPSLDATFYAHLFNGRGESTQIAEAFAQSRSPSESRKIDGETGELSAQLPDHSVPKVAARWHTVQEEHMFARPGANLVHTKAFCCNIRVCNHPAVPQDACSRLQNACIIVARQRNMPSVRQKHIEDTTPRGLIRAYILFRLHAGMV